MISQGEILIRHLETGDLVSQELLGKWGLFYLDCEWVWIVEHEGTVEAILITAPMHGVLFLLRIAATKNAPRAWMVVMLRRVLREAKERGLLAVMTYLTATKEELKLVRLATREGWLGVPETGMWLMGPCEVKH